MSFIKRIKRSLFYYPSISYGLAGGHFENGNYEKALAICEKAINYGYSNEFQRLMCLEFIELAIQCCTKLDERGLWGKISRLIDGSEVSTTDVKSYSIVTNNLKRSM